MRVFSTFLCWLLLALTAGAAQTDQASKIASLIDPAKLVMLGERGDSAMSRRTCDALGCLMLCPRCNMTMGDEAQTSPPQMCLLQSIVSS